MQLTLIRHSPTVLNSTICYGQSDIDVDENFPQHAQHIAKKCESIDFEHLYSSPLKRCTKLAKKLAKDTFTIDSRLCELNFGQWEMTPWDEIPRTQLDTWANNYFKNSPPLGETYEALTKRSVSFLRDIQSQHQGQKIVVITHAGVIRAMLGYALEIPYQNHFRLNIHFNSLSQISFSQSLTQVQFINR